METTKKIGILGYGQIGQAIASFYKDPFIQDVGPEFWTTQQGHLQLDVLHVCIPCKDQEEFVRVVRQRIADHCKFGLVIIHSTVPVGTTAKVAEQLSQFVVHSPIRGVHPHLAEGIKIFPKYIGADFSGAGRLVAEHFEEIGITPVVLYKSRTSELLKLLDTTYYGVAIAFHAYAKDLCEKEGLNFDMVMTAPNRSYNEGYAALGKTNVVRPVLFAPPDGKIGGHCVVPNAELLKEQYGTDPLLEAILRHK